MIGAIVLALLLGVLYLKHEQEVGYFIVESESMEPTLKIGDRLVMEKAETYAKGEIVVFEPPTGGSLLVKRIVALSGERVSTKDDDLTVGPETDPAPPKGKTWIVKPGEAFVAGDNRAVSKDSRDYGPIPLTRIHGKVNYRVRSIWSWERVK